VTPWNLFVEKLFEQLNFQATVTISDEPRSIARGSGGGPSKLPLAFKLSQLGCNPQSYPYDNTVSNTDLQVQSWLSRDIQPD
jgi:hypothetical protein